MLSATALRGLQCLHKGKVRDVYAVDEQRLLIVTTDRLSAFDVVLPDPVPGKGRVLNRLSRFWFRKTAGLVANHLLDTAPEELLDAADATPAVCERSAVVVRTQPLPFEAVVRGYLTGGGWNEYRESGSVSGLRLPDGMRNAERLAEPIFTPATKAAAGAHDENVSFETIAAGLGDELAARVRDISLALYAECAEYALERDIIIADTKFEFGLTADGELILIDEVLTPDSSRFWAVEDWRPGGSPPSFDKQFVRDHLESMDWDKTPPGPRLSAEVIGRTAEKYARIASILGA